MLDTILKKCSLFLHHLKVFLHIIPKTPPIPDDEMAVLKISYITTSNIVADLAKQATVCKKNIAEAKNQHKRDFYNRKFDKIKPKFQDELQRLHQIKQILDDNNITVDDSEMELTPEQLGL